MFERRPMSGFTGVGATNAGASESLTYRYCGHSFSSGREIVRTLVLAFPAPAFLGFGKMQEKHKQLGPRTCAGEILNIVLERARRLMIGDMISARARPSRG